MTSLLALSLVVLAFAACQPSSSASRESVAPSDLERSDAAAPSPREFAEGKSDDEPPEADHPPETAPHPSPASTAVGRLSTTVANAAPVGSSPPASSSAAVSVEKKPVPKDPPVRPPPSIESCNDHNLNPECFSAFPEKVTCPAAFSAVPVASYCGLQGTTSSKRCTYPQGVCSCAHTPYCGGAYPTMLQQSGMKWECHSPRTADDCPEGSASGKTCRKAGQKCGYGGCGTSTQCTCTDGKYKCTTQHWAPPP